MLLPTLDDTIIAISSSWQPSTAGILRLSGPRAFELPECVGVSPVAGPDARSAGCADCRITVRGEFTLPATLFWFRQPRTYTGQDVVEIHTVGNLPVLRCLSAWFIEHGARRALPGEFTARAYLNGRLDADQVEDVLALVQAQDQAANLQTLRSQRNGLRLAREEACRELSETLATVEAGIDFSEEDDVRFITDGELTARLSRVIELMGVDTGSGGQSSRSELPHVALAGLPNSGKSTLFNALLGCERALVTPILGTTRDVISAEIEVAGIRMVLQDCAGLGSSVDELEAAAHLAAERALDQADLVLWLHAVGEPWGSEEVGACTRIGQDRRLLVLSKCDLRGESGGVDLPFVDVVKVSAHSGAGLDRLREKLGNQIKPRPGGVGAHPEESFRQVRLLLERLYGKLVSDERILDNPEIVSLELRQALAQLRRVDSMPLAEEVLERIYARFCVGK